MPTQQPPAVLTIAGSDCSAGAGIQADLKTFQHFRTHGLTAITCVVSETANIVRAVHPVPVGIVRDQILLLLDSFPLAAIKTGMLYSAAHVTAVADVLKDHRHIPLIVDPVMIASTGAPLLEPDAIIAYRELLLPLATLITPNLPEADVLLGYPIPDLTALEPAALQLSKIFNTAILLKGGHLEGTECIDLLADQARVHSITAPRIPVSGSHGTGCTLSAAITAAIANGNSISQSIKIAKAYLGLTLRHSYTFQHPDGEVIHALNQGTYFPLETAS